MFRWFGSSLASKLRLTKNDFQLVDSRLSWRRNYAGKNSKFIGPYTKYKSVLAEAMCNEASKVLAKGVKALDLREGIQMAIRAVSKSLSSRARMISTSEEIAQGLKLSNVKVKLRNPTTLRQRTGLLHSTSHFRVCGFGFFPPSFRVSPSHSLFSL